MKILAWNVNGLRSILGKGALQAWLEKEGPDVACLGEIKATPEQVDEAPFLDLGYKCFWAPAVRKGYSGLLTLSRVPVRRSVPGMGRPEFDSEGRWLLLDLDGLAIINTYFPNSQPDHARLPYKLAYCDAALAACEKLRRDKFNLVICGDFNIAHKPIDLARPKENENTHGFLPEERAWMDRFTGEGYVDTFRKFEPGPGHYTWWSFRPGVRKRNIGWRIDYHWVNGEFGSAVKRAWIEPEVMGSDHCPVGVEIDA